MAIRVKFNSQGRNHIRRSYLKRENFEPAFREGKRWLHLNEEGQRVSRFNTTSHVVITWDDESVKEVFKEVQEQATLFTRVMGIVRATHDLTMYEGIDWNHPRSEMRRKNLEGLRRIVESKGLQAGIDWWIENT